MIHKLLKGKPAGLIFDLDGTLIDSLELNWKAMDSALREQGVVIERQEFIDLTGRSIEEITDIIVTRHGRPDADRKAIIARKRELANSHADDVVEHKIVADVARLCHGKIPLAVGTGADGHRARLMLKATGLLDLFDHIVSADDVDNHKPHPDTFLRCAELMGVDPALCQVFEDGEPGLEAARRAGMMYIDVRPFL
ncbi:MAG: HAD-IA family hydrolase [Bacteroidales bacterium]|nr:HAD-IA family hydrolase [Bacteroidales bacterium]MDD7725142.1 HAD-IA family hydrolase [Bacteroidales bacterium]MDY4173773.1 HAD-IA family hydrolase [Bacteroidales bacterium]